MSLVVESTHAYIAMSSLTDPSVASIAWPSHRDCVAIWSGVVCWMPRSMSCLLLVAGFVGTGDCMKGRLPSIMNWPAWKFPVTGMHPIGKELVQCGLI